MKKYVAFVVVVLQLSVASGVEAASYRYVLKRKQAVAGVKDAATPFCHARKKITASEPLKSQLVRNGALTSRFFTLKTGDIREVLKDRKSKSRCVFVHTPEKHSNI